MEPSNIINFSLGLMIILLIFKMIFYKHEYEPFNSYSYILNCRKYPYLCRDITQTQYQNESLYIDKRQNYLNNVLEKISPRYNPSSRNKKKKKGKSIILTRRRFFDPYNNDDLE